jgi:hypothetical protein
MMRIVLDLIMRINTVASISFIRHKRLKCTTNNNVHCVTHRTALSYDELSTIINLSQPNKDYLLSNSYLLELFLWAVSESLFCIISNFFFSWYLEFLLCFLCLPFLFISLQIKWDKSLFKLFSIDDFWDIAPTPFWCYKSLLEKI